MITAVDFTGIKTQQKNPFAIIIDNIFDKQYCDELIEISETTNKYSPATIQDNGNNSSSRSKL